MGRLVLPLLFFPVFLLAQKPSCQQLEAIIHEQVTTLRYADAHQTWLDRGKCPMIGDTVFVDVEKSLRYLIDNATAADQALLIKQLAKLYEQVGAAQEDKTQRLLVRKAMMLQHYKAATPDELFVMLDRAYRADKKGFTEPKAIQLYFSLCIERFKSGKYKVADTDLFALYDDLALIIRQCSIEASDSQLRNFQSVQNGMRVAMASIISCPKLISYYAAGYQLHADDAVWLENATLSLSGNRCTIDSLFGTIAEKWFAVSPCKESAYQAAVAAMRVNNRQIAIERFEAAAGFETKPAQQAKLFHTIASSLVATDAALAFSYVQKALAADSGYGKAYLLWAQLVQGATVCAQSAFEQKALSLLAAEIALQAGKVEPSLSATAVKQAELYKKKGPSPEEIKAEKMAGKIVSFGCWINQSVNIPVP